jgi:hypothetical protein
LCENAEALTTRDFGEVDVFDHLAVLAAVKRQRQLGSIFVQSTIESGPIKPVLHSLAKGHSRRFGRVSARRKTTPIRQSNKLPRLAQTRANCPANFAAPHRAMDSPAQSRTGIPLGINRANVARDLLSLRGIGFEDRNSE